MQLFCILNVLVNTTSAYSGPEISAAIAKSAAETVEKSQGPEILDPFHHRFGMFDELLPAIRFPHPKTGVVARPVCIHVPDLHKFPGMIFKLPIGFGIPNEVIPGLSPLPDIFGAGPKDNENSAGELPGIFPSVDSGADFLGIGELIKVTFGSDDREEERQRAALSAMQAEAPEKVAPKPSQSKKAQSNGANGAAAAAASTPAELPKKSAPKAAPQTAKQPTGSAPSPALPQEISAAKVPATEPLPALAAAVPETLSAVASSVSSVLPVVAPSAPPAQPAPKDPISSVVSAVPGALSAAASALPIPPLA